MPERPPQDLIQDVATPDESQNVPHCRPLDTRHAAGHGRRVSSSKTNLSAEFPTYYVLVYFLQKQSRRWRLRPDTPVKLGLAAAAAAATLAAATVLRAHGAGHQVPGGEQIFNANLFTNSFMREI